MARVVQKVKGPKRSNLPIQAIEMLKFGKKPGCKSPGPDAGGTKMAQQNCCAIKTETEYGCQAADNPSKAVTMQDAPQTRLHSDMPSAATEIHASLCAPSGIK